MKIARPFALGIWCWLLLAPQAQIAAVQDSAACQQARQIVTSVAAALERGDPDPAALLNRLATARDLCPALGDAWKYSACAARAAGQQAKAQIYSDRAVLNGVADLTCSVAGAVPLPTPKLGAIRDKYALVVGIGNFQDERIPKLRYTTKDARDFRDYLVDPHGGQFDPGKVELLLDGQATREGILKAIQRIILRAQEQDLLVVYVSSHGSPLENSLGLQGVGYIVTYDTNVDDLYVEALEFQSFSETISRVRAQRKVTFLDTCFSGQAGRVGAKNLAVTPLGVSPETAKLFTSTEGSYLVTSSDASEKSWESDRLQNSFFTYYLLAALRQPGDPPTLKEVFAELSRKVAAGVLQEKNAIQKPQLHPASASADLRIGAPPISN